jgi:hypothetical protein
MEQRYGTMHYYEKFQELGWISSWERAMELGRGSVLYRTVNGTAAS